ncbi:Glycosylphosphatidylinositol-mannosyltransferase I [Macleaya cordata]|uniref:Glycosylphosphatidylinositol-mannosyltransferase I n=1 Tax=Macleaya cordata TaxID=56857 RepID=A0A200PXF0_MACCD|nr:Glycosylphosphatidylinositol-mannosyltransferase I [Macleaya cordata]
MSNVNYSGNPDIVGSLRCSQKYLLESYFEKHNTVLDSDFQSFLAHELPLGSCKALRNLNSMIRLPVLQRDLIGEGSHRHLFSSIKFNIQPETISELPAHFCEAVVIDRLPAGVFADPFELQHLVQRGVFFDAAVFGDTNLELPTALSNRSVVEVHMDIGHNILSRHNNGLEINVELPLHARYPPLGGSGYSRVVMDSPDLFIRCSIEQKSQYENCLWMTTVERIESPADAVVWRIPSGNKAHSGVVSIVTFISAFLSTVSIVLAAVYSSDTNSSKNLKKS